MIELLRYARVKPQGLVSAELMPGGWNGGPDDPGVLVKFKRFDVENGKEVEPEKSFLSFVNLEKRLAEITIEREVLIELLALKKE